MIRKLLPLMVVSAVALAAWSPCLAGEYRRSSAEDLFNNYYVPPVGDGGVGAELYLCPRPTPPVVGHTYVTYQPLMPHEFLYPHHRTYVRNHPGGGRTLTCVTWTRDWDFFGWLNRPPRPVNAPRWYGKCNH